MKRKDNIFWAIIIVCGLFLSRLVLDDSDGVFPHVFVAAIIGALMGGLFSLLRFGWNRFISSLDKTHPKGFSANYSDNAKSRDEVLFEKQMELTRELYRIKKERDSLARDS